MILHNLKNLTILLYFILYPFTLECPLPKIKIVPIFNKIDKYYTTNASWYGKFFNGKKTANGEIFDENNLTAASVTLPFNTLVKVTNLENNKSVTVRINDRGAYDCYVIDGKVIPYYPLRQHPSRHLDLSKKAFESISSIKKGVIKIKYAVLK